MSDTSTTQKRPATVVVVAILVFAGALLQFCAAAIAIMFTLRPGEAQKFFSSPVSDWYWVMTAVLSLVLGLIYLWIGRGLLRADAQAWMLVNILALINLVFAVFQLPFGTGWVALGLSVIILLLNNSPANRVWFRTD